MLAKMVCRHVAEGAEPDTDTHNSLCALVGGQRIDLLHQILYQRGFVHQQRTSYTMLQTGIFFGVSAKYYTD